MVELRSTFYSLKFDEKICGPDGRHGIVYCWLSTVKVKELILVGVEAMHCLSEGNETTQAAMLAAGHFDPIIRVLAQTRYQSVQVYDQ